MPVKGLQTRIILEEAPQKLAVGNDAKALMVQRGGSSQNHGHKKRFAFFYCKKKAHKIAECRKIQKNEDSNGRNENSGG